MNGTPLVSPSRQGDWLKFEEDSHYSRDNIVLVSGAGNLSHGTVLGKLTSGDDAGKYTAFNPAGTTGEETAAGILCEGVDATSADVAGSAIVRHAHIAASGLAWHAEANLQSEKDAALATLATLGILTVREV